LTGVVGPAAAQREPVLQQIAVPHSYYYREMYLPQLTSGPSSVAWTADGAELIYSMQGSLWRQRPGSDEAIQLTDGPGYDYQPDASADGRWAVYSSYRNDGLELWALELATGRSRPLLANGAVTVEPRFSPDGRRLAFVSTSFEGRWHVFVADFADGAVTNVSRVTEDVDSKLPRYYYSAYDHYLSPTWSPDGRELIVISNAGRVWGTGGFWRMEARPGGRPRLIHDEETTWKARPDWSRDGKRVAYSSYLGRQWNQLWLMTAEGGDPLQLTYGEFDNTAPRWSPDARRIAFITNEGGSPGLAVIDVPGGAVQRITPARRRWLAPRRRLTLDVSDPQGRPLPARLAVAGADGRAYAPSDAWIHADDGFDRAERPREFTYFHAAGRVTLDVPDGRYVIEVTRGLEYERHVDTVAVGATSVTRRYRLDRLADLPALGWWSGDAHVHMNYGGTYRNTPARLRLQAEAEDLHLIENLVVNKEARIPDIAYWSGRLDPASTSATLIKHDEEYHTSYWGHTALLGLTRHFVLPNYAAYVNTAAASLYPHNTAVFELARLQGGVTGYVHPFDAPPDPGAPGRLSHALPVDAALGRLGYLEVVGFSDHLATAQVWYRLLNAGLRIPAGAGTDAMANFASLRGPVGMCRVFVKAGRLDYRAWLDGLVAGRTFATNGPLLQFTLGGLEPGAALALGPGRHQLRASVWVRSIVAVDSAQIVANGRVVATIPLAAAGTRADTTVSVAVDGSAWYTLRAFARRSRHPTLDIYPFATTSPIYVTVGGRPIRSSADARYFTQWIERLERDAAAHPGWNTTQERDQVLADLRRARETFLTLAAESGPAGR
jgi:Tol biopolymer transport system component